jgi:hypothetical protein
MKTYWPILRDKVRHLCDKGVRVVEVEAIHEPEGERRLYWSAWGIDGLPADWKELGLDEALSELAHELTREHDGFFRLYIYPRGYRLEHRSWGEDWELVEQQGTSGKNPIEPRHWWLRTLRERLEHLVRYYRIWYHHNAPKEWQETHSPEPTLENILEWGKAMEEWSILEEPLVPKLLQEILGKEG